MEYEKLIEEFGETKLPLGSARILPSLSDPVYVPAGKATHVRHRDEVIGLTHGEVIRAYPNWIMDNYHVVNDLFPDAGLMVVH